MCRPARSGLIVAVLAVLAGPALAADLDEPPPSPYGVRPDYAPPPPPPPRFSRDEETCRVFVRRRIDADGEEVVRRVRVCDAGAGPEGPPRWHRHRPWRLEGFGPPHERYAPPVPPAEVPGIW
ncbi:hypothetical protein [Methylobacterium sp. ID0610]|uniref:hypothetical protein n=1 Tax=Methylobacterium carpenticola TaxID=3344827 RepID=UPI0036B39B6C